MAGKNTTRTTITLEIEDGKIVKATGSYSAQSRNVAPSEIERLYQKSKGGRQLAARVRADESASLCYAYIWFGGKWVKVPVPC